MLGASLKSLRSRRQGAHLAYFPKVLRGQRKEKERGDIIGGLYTAGDEGKKGQKTCRCSQNIFFPWLLELLLVLIRKGEEEEKKRGKRKFDFQIFFPYPFGMP